MLIQPHQNFTDSQPQRPLVAFVRRLQRNVRCANGCFRHLFQRRRNPKRPTLTGQLILINKIQITHNCISIGTKCDLGECLDSQLNHVKSLRHCAGPVMEQTSHLSLSWPSTVDGCGHGSARFED